MNKENDQMTTLRKTLGMVLIGAAMIGLFAACQSVDDNDSNDFDEDALAEAEQAMLPQPCMTCKLLVKPTSSIASIMVTKDYCRGTKARLVFKSNPVKSIEFTPSCSRITNVTGPAATGANLSVWWTAYPTQVITVPLTVIR